MVVSFFFLKQIKQSLSKGKILAVETMALKGLFLNNLEKKEEGYDYVKKGLLKDLTSHICKKKKTFFYCE